MGNKRTTIALIFFCIVLPFLYYINVGGQARYYYEASSGKEPAFFMDLGVVAENEKGDYAEFEAEEAKANSYSQYQENWQDMGLDDLERLQKSMKEYNRYQVNIPPKYKKYTFLLHGRVLNGAKDVTVTVNNEPVRVELSAPQGSRCFWSPIYLEKHFYASLELRNGRNLITVISGNNKSTIVVQKENNRPELDLDEEMRRAGVIPRN